MYKNHAQVNSFLDKSAVKFNNGRLVAFRTVDLTLLAGVACSLRSWILE